MAKLDLCIFFYKKMRVPKKPHTNALHLLSLFFLTFNCSASVAQKKIGEVREIHVLEMEKLGIQSLGSLSYSFNSDTFFIGESEDEKNIKSSYHIQKLSSLGDMEGDFHVRASIPNAINSTFNTRGKQLLLLNNNDELIAIKENQAGDLRLTDTKRYNIKKIGLNNPQGLATDPKTGTLYILDAAKQQILMAKPDAKHGFASISISKINLGLPDSKNLRGIAFNPTNNHLYVLNATQRKLYELTQQGNNVLTYDLSTHRLNNPQSILFAPSGDQTDEYTQMSLYLADVGLNNNINFFGNARIIEFSLLSDNHPSPNRTLAPASTATLINIINTSELNPPSPNSSGITYLENTNTFLESDNKAKGLHALFTGDNQFKLTLDGIPIATSTVVDQALFSTPKSAGISGVNPINHHIFISDNDAHKIVELSAGADHQYGTADDIIISSIDTNTFFPISDDPEGVAFAPGIDKLFMIDGHNNEVYCIASGKNGVFDGASPQGDDIVTHFDTERLGLLNPEGIEYNPATGNLLAVGTFNKQTLFELSIKGELIQLINISSALQTGLNNPAGLTLGPSSIYPSDTHIYIIDRGEDSALNGKIFEMSFAASASNNHAPSVNVGGDLTIPLANSVNLDGVVKDDSLSKSPATITTIWSKVSGPGIVTFANLNHIKTTTNFSVVGTYILKLHANDGNLTSTDEVSVVVKPNGATHIFETRISSSLDDAENNSAGIINLSSPDLDIAGPLVGLRFTSIDIPAGSKITKAYIQFKADKTNATTTSLTIKGEFANNATTFLSTTRNIADRKKTISSIVWAPKEWVAGDAGEDQKSPDISPIVQEITDQLEWSNNNAMVLILDQGPGRREAVSFNKNPSGAPLLHIEYILQPNTL